MTREPLVYQKHNIVGVDPDGFTRHYGPHISSIEEQFAIDIDDEILLAVQAQLDEIETGQRGLFK